MSTISDTSTAQLFAQRPQHAHGADKSRFASTISSEVSAGSLSSTDATALTKALGSIDASLSSDRTGSTAGNATGAKLDPSSIKDRIDGLISDQVGSGALTSDQATELKNLFASHGQSTRTADATGGVADAGGPPPGPPPSGTAPGDPSAGSRSARGSTSTSTSDLLSTFIQQLQAAQSSSASYGASGTSAGTNATALLFDFQS